MGYGTIARRVGVGKGEVVNWLTGRYDPLRRHVLPIVGPHLAYGIGAWIGDGTLVLYKKRWKHFTRLIVKDVDFAQAFAESLAISLGRQKPLHLSRRKDGRYSVYANNRMLYDFLLASRACPDLLKPIIGSYPGYFLGGFWDAEGSIGLSKSILSIHAVNTRKEIVSLVLFTLDRLNIHYTLHSRMKERLVKFSKGGKAYHRRHPLLYKIYVRSCCHLKFQQNVIMKIGRKYERLTIAREGMVKKRCTTASGPQLGWKLVGPAGFEPATSLLPFTVALAGPSRVS